jgi:hypothetical protein
MGAAKTITRAGDDGDAAVKPDCHECSPRMCFLVMPGLDPGIHQKKKK